ncbi:hypothetical protein psyc5s11_53600 [Clostridium gelidum]|uniref:DUF3784 domain-containing protein n=1 Tax=Clostridium gelidum TaxID=704125 RepID=A0ABN6J688_9CLOT|nr:hypothetical protein psyc5s11_53600 [Clostridium gelidum]
MSQSIYFLGEYFFLLLSLLLSLIGINCYFNLFKNINTLKINRVKKKYTITDEKEYLKFEGIYSLLIGTLSFINFLVIVFKKDLIFPIILVTTVIINIIIYLSNNIKKKILRNK